MKQLFFKSLCILLLISISYGCKKNGRAERKKLPDPTSIQGIGGENIFQDFNLQANTLDLPFYVNDTVMLIGGSRQNFQSFALPNPAYDFVAREIAKAYEPLAIPLLAQLLELGKKGLLVDLREGEENTGNRTDFLITVRGEKNLSLSIVFLWSRASDARATAFIRELQSFSLINYRLINKSLTNPLTSQLDCFSATSDTWEH